MHNCIKSFFFFTADSIKNTQDITKKSSEEITSFLIILHSTLKSEEMAAIVSFGNDWFGAIGCSNDPKAVDKKKNYLTLNVFQPGEI